jgi:hypothetical protein
MSTTAKRSVALLGLALLLTMGTAAAQTYEPGAAVVSNANPAPGEAVTVSGSGCVAGEPVDVEIAGQVTSTTADPNGDWSVSVAAPTEPGVYTVTATCGTRVLNSQLTVGGTGATAGAPIPRTGSSSTVDLSRVAVLLGAAGGVFVLLARRRRTAASTTA